LEITFIIPFIIEIYEFITPKYQRYYFIKLLIIILSRQKIA
jgi:hypothetical protein